MCSCTKSSTLPFCYAVRGKSRRRAAARAPVPQVFFPFLVNSLDFPRELCKLTAPSENQNLNIMAHTQSAKKRIRQTIARTAINRSVMSRVRTLRKKVDAAVEGKDKEAAVAAYNNFASVIDKAAKRGTVPANRAANYKSKAAKAIASIA